MPFETEGRFLQPFHNSLDINQQVYEELIHPIQVGGIVYANNRRGIVLVEYGIDELRGFDNALREDFSLEKMDEGRGRIVVLNDLTKIKAGQLEKANLSIRAYESLRGRPSVSVEILYKDVVDQKNRKDILDEDTVLRFLTGQDGGIAIFEGWGLPEENALVFKTGKDESRGGLVLFVHPNESQAGINSVKGVREFFEELNREFTENCSTPLLKKSLEVLREKMKSKTISFDSPVKAEIFKAQIIANVRLFEKTGELGYMDFLNRHLYDVSSKRGIIDVFRRNNIGSLASIADESVNNLFIASNFPLQLEGQFPAKERTIYDKLKTEEAKVIRKKPESYFGDFSTGAMRRYAKDLVLLARYARVPDQFEDIKTLLRELKTWDIINGEWGFYTYIDKAELKYKAGWLVVNNNSRRFIRTLEVYMSLQEVRYHIQQEDIFEKLKTEKLKKIREIWQVKGYQMEYGKGISDYLKELVSAVYEIETPEEFEDLEVLLEEIDDKEGYEKWLFKLVEDKKANFFIKKLVSNKPDKEGVRLSEIFKELRVDLEKRRKLFENSETESVLSLQTRFISP